MCKRLFLLTFISLLIATPSFASVGIFEKTEDVGAVAGIGSTVYENYVFRVDDMLITEQYLITGGGADVWGSKDEFHFAYNTLSGDLRLSFGYEWLACPNGWTKVMAMLRTGTETDAVNYTTLTRRDQSLAQFQGRDAAGSGSWSQKSQRADNKVEIDGEEVAPSKPYRMAIQKISVGDLTYIEGIVDWGMGAGYITIGSTRLVFGFPDEVLAGIGLVSHKEDGQQRIFEKDHALGQVRVYDVLYEANPSFVTAPEFPLVPADAALAAPPSDISGFSIRCVSPIITTDWGRDAMAELLDTGSYGGIPALPGLEPGSLIPIFEVFVNLYDSDGRGEFSEDNGYPDQTFPGIDPFEEPAANPGAGDDDNNFATEVLGCIELTAGIHIIGVNDDDGTIVEVGGVEIGRSGEWKGASNTLFVFEVEVDGYYDFRARHLEGGGGAALELHEIFADGTRILLNDTANGGSTVYAPAGVVPTPAPVEPAPE